MPQSDRAKRLHPHPQRSQRTGFQRDRDSILYSSAFRRLAGITEIVRAGEADVFHTRQQHTMKVAQVGLRLAEQFVKDQQEIAREYGIEPEVVEAACLAHDLGHPPFGHAGEHHLDKLVVEAGDSSGFEGNAQSFRIVTKLAARYESCPGLNLTRATLAALLKYPWMRAADDPKKQKKWNAYPSEAAELTFATEGRRANEAEKKSAEAEIMDWADDITYSVHDLEDFHRCGALPWHQILGKTGRDSLVQAASANWFGAPKNAIERLESAHTRLQDLIKIGYENILSQTFVGTREQRVSLRTLSSELIGRYVSGTKLNDDYDEGTYLKVPNELSDEVLLLKEITRNYIISNPSLVAQQRGQKKILGDLFAMLMEDTNSSNGKFPNYVPYRLQTYWNDESVSVTSARKVCDALCSLTEKEVVGLHSRLTGTAAGSVLDPLIR